MWVHKQYKKKISLKISEHFFSARAGSQCLAGSLDKRRRKEGGKDGKTTAVLTRSHSRRLMEDQL